MFDFQNEAYANVLNERMAKHPKNFRMGVVDGRGILLRRPSFDCKWYWSFGYLGNSQCHYHLDGIESDQNKHMFDKLKLHFGDSLTITDDRDLWKFCEISLTIYTLKKTADLCHTGGSHTTTNPGAELLKNADWYRHIVEVLIPAQIDELYKVLEKYSK
jgi:hypothetical protein